ncbi:hypothetical protein CI109_100382 [Kwoniella shandongensis]|uniref:Uncharacterized protein n=1 Tax=Kwoniella shandongensis TaxID=1734106 RepID=A0A5M6C8U9_9TREE|nr:uncharacterized protein CI109_001775 [Kwoniella shandongensis]KAA5529835.1 hypothetical protein CI109_001775 [Kwoniella shandongensis]
MLFPTKLAIFSTLIAAAKAQLSVNTPASLIECQPASLSWTATTAPYYIAFLPGGQVSAAALEQLSPVQSAPYTWTVNIAANTNITIRITDGTGAIAYSSPVVIQAGSNSACLTSVAADASTTAGGAATGSSGASATTTGSASRSGSAAGSATSSAGAATSSAASAGLVTRESATGLVGILGLVAVAVGVLA